MQEETLAQIRTAYLEHRWDDWCRLVDQAKTTEWGKDHSGLLTEIGVAHLCGWGKDRDTQRAFELFKRAAQMRDPEGLYRLGCCYRNGQGTPIDLRVAAELVEQAARLEHARAKYILGCFLTDTFPLNKDEACADDLFAQALPTLREEAGAGCVDACAHLGRCLFNGHGIVKDSEEAVSWFCKAAQQGYALAQNSLGLCYAQGEGVSKDQEEAVSWFYKAARQGYALAQYNLGVRYAQGDGVSKDQEEAMSWFCKAAQQGYALAQNNLGVCYEWGEGVSKDQEKAASWYYKAAQQGYAPAQNSLGVCYEWGEGVSKHPKKAVLCYHKAAQQGFANAQNNLGRCYSKGEGVSEDPKKAVSWYYKAAQQGYGPAQFNLGVCYDGGLGVSEDQKKAVFWYRKAAKQGEADAQDMILLEDAEGNAQRYLVVTLTRRKLLSLVLHGAQNDEITGQVTVDQVNETRTKLPAAIKACAKSTWSRETFQGKSEAENVEIIVQALLSGDLSHRLARPRLASLWRESPELLSQPPVSGDTVLVEALKKEQLDAARVLLALGADPRVTSADGVAPADVAPNEDILRKLYEHGADMGSVIRRALSEGYLDVIEAIVSDAIVQLPDHCANARDADGRTLLHLAVRHDRVDLAEMLIRHDVDVNTHDETGATPLREASSRAHARLVSMLLEHGADAGDVPASERQEPSQGAEAPDRGRSTSQRREREADPKELARVAQVAPDGFACNVAAQNLPDEDMLALMREPDGDGRTPAYWAACEGHANCVRFLARIVPESLSTPVKGATPVFAAVLRGHADCLKILAETVPDSVSVPEETCGATPAHVAAAKGDVECLRILADTAPHSLGACDKEGATPAYSAAANGHVECLRALSEVAPDSLTRPAENGVTPMHAAVSEGHQSCVELLANQGITITESSKPHKMQAIFYDRLFGGLDDGIRLLRKRKGETVCVICGDGTHRPEERLEQRAKTASSSPTSESDEAYPEQTVAGVPFVEVPASRVGGARVAVSEYEARARMIRHLAECSDPRAIENLLRLLQFDGRGELAVHASMALAVHQDADAVEGTIRACYNKAPVVSGSGWPPKAGDDVYPRSRLLFPFTWNGKTDVMAELLNNSGPWPGAGQGVLHCYQLIEDVRAGRQAVVDRIVYMECLDEGGARDLMELTVDLYPELHLTRELWSGVSYDSTRTARSEDV